MKLKQDPAFYSTLYASIERKLAFLLPVKEKRNIKMSAYPSQTLLGCLVGTRLESKKFVPSLETSGTRKAFSFIGISRMPGGVQEVCVKSPSEFIGP